MAKIYSAPEHIKAPTYDFSKFNRKEWQAEEERYRTELKNYCLERFRACADPDPMNTEELIGETITFPMADSQAEYMVASVKPPQLIHMEVGDAWQFEYANKLNSKDIKQKVEEKQRFQKMWAKLKSAKESQK